MKLTSSLLHMLSSYVLLVQSKAAANNDVWYPLPPNFDQKDPDTLLAKVQQFAQTQPQNNKLPFDNIYVFGDSACDTGNLFKLSEYTDPDPKYYWKGRFSNGPMWPDYLQAQYNLKVKNFAYGGAVISTYNYVNLEGVPDFADQISEYLKKGNQFPPNSGRSLTLLQFVGNDLVNRSVTAQKAVNDFELMLQWLIDIGEMKNFLVFESAITDYNTWGYSSKLAEMVQKVQARTKLDGVTIEFLPIVNEFGKMVANPPPTADKGKWAPLDSSCFNQNTKVQCKDPQNHFRYDLYHPSTVPNYNTAMLIGKAIKSLFK